MDVREIIEACAGDEGEPPEGLARAVEAAGEAARLAARHGGGWGGYGGRQLRERVMRVADWAAAQREGDIAHVGHGGGDVTSGLAAVAQKHGCRVVAVNAGASDEELRAFEEVMTPYWDNKYVFRRLAKDDRLGRILREAYHWRFAFVSDQDNSFRSYFEDVMLFTSCPVVCVDYCMCLDGPRLAFEAAAALQGRVMIRDARCREGYLVMP